ncbi:MAG: hypothetical protein Q8L48_11470 [Archangium sp.]|nr:hypothetical protein [Archangium sp.]
MRKAALLGLALLTGCGAPIEMDLDAGTAPDAGRRDAGITSRDGGSDAGVDAGLPDAGPRDAGPNHLPVVNATVLQNRATAYAGQIVELALGATDEDGDRLSFTWSGPGSFFENGNPSAQRWFSDELTAPAQVTLTVSVTDGRSAPITRQVVVAVTVPRFLNVFSEVLSVPVLQGGQCVGCHGSMGDYQVAAIQPVAWQQLVGADHHRGQACINAGLTKMVVAGDRQRSLLYRKMTSTQPAGCGDGMPAMSMVSPASPLSYIVTVGSWIATGAPND